MKKIITTLAFIALSSFSAKAIDMPNLGNFSITGGVAANQSVWGATAKQDEYNMTGTAIDATNTQSGAFAESFSSGFVELGIGQYVSLGYEHVPGSISTPQNINSGGNVGTAAGDTSKVSVDFNDFTTYYAKLNIPFMSGMYLKAGMVETDLDIKETQKSGNTYKNVSVDGTSFGAGYNRYLGDTNFSLRLEGNYVELDNVTVNNGAIKTAGTTANGGFNEVKASNLEGLTGKVALTYTFGRN
tara:strand:+ start:459 stop:1187 length:729 start_codon:yes stop_codon:yes gene_type:complete